MSISPLKDISTSFQETLINSDLKDVTVELAEISLDNLFTEGVLKEVPILSSILALGRATLNIRDQLFLKKIIYFISEINTISPEERQKMIDSIDKSEKYKIKVGEKLLYIIDKSDDYKSAEIVAKLFAGFLKGKMSYDDFLRCSMMINNIFYSDLKFFIDSDKKSSYSVEEIGDLLGSGLYDIEMEPLDITVTDRDDWKSDEKYKTDIDGGTLRAYVSSIGRLLKEMLKSQL